MRLAVLLIPVAVCSFAVAQEGNTVGLPKSWSGVVLDIVDGDGVYVSGSEYQLRLFGVDAPARGEKNFDEATKVLADLIDDKEIRVEPQYWQPATGRYKARIVARIWLGQIEVNQQVIERGPAREYCRYSKGIYGHC